MAMARLVRTSGGAFTALLHDAAEGSENFAATQHLH